MNIKLVELNAKNELYNSITCNNVPVFDVNAVISEFIADRLHGMVLNINCRLSDADKYEVVVKTTVNS